MALVEEAASHGHVAGRLALRQKTGGRTETPVEEIGMRRQAGLLGEGADEVAAGEPRHISEIGKVRLLAHVSVQMIPHPQDALRAVSQGREGIQIGHLLPGLEELKGAGLLEGRLPPGLAVPTPSDDMTLSDDEDPLDDDLFTPLDPGEGTEEREES